MKMKFLAVAALCGLGMTSCTNDLIENAPAPVGSPVKITLQADQNTPQTRADYTEDANDNTLMNFSWRSGDAMSVAFAGNTGDNYELTTTEAGQSASFTGTVTSFTGTKTIYAFYPYNSTSYTITDGQEPEIATADLTLPVPQLYTVGGALSNSFLVGSGSASATGTSIEATASMKQVMSIIKLNITNAPAKVTGVKLKCAEALFPTTATVALTDATISNPGTFVDELTLTVTDNTTEATKAVSLAMFPTDGLIGKKISITVTFEGGESKTIEKTGVDFVRNMHYSLEFDAENEIAIGSFYLNDGTILKKSTQLTPEQQAACIGIVYLVNADGISGKIVNIDAVEGMAWSTEKVVTGATSDTDGATNTAKVLNLGSYSTQKYPAFALCTDYNAIAPAGISWYIPAKREWTGNLINNKEIINASLGKVSGATQLNGSGYYLSSTERNKNEAFDIYFANGTTNSFGSKDNKGLSLRLISAF